MYKRRGNVIRTALFGIGVFLFFDGRSEFFNRARGRKKHYLPEDKLKFMFDDGDKGKKGYLTTTELMNLLAMERPTRLLDDSSAQAIRMSSTDITRDDDAPVIRKAEPTDSGTAAAALNEKHWSFHEYVRIREKLFSSEGNVYARIESPAQSHEKSWSERLEDSSQQWKYGRDKIAMNYRLYFGDKFFGDKPSSSSSSEKELLENSASNKQSDGVEKVVSDTTVSHAKHASK
jgi:hypothetical protein